MSNISPVDIPAIAGIIPPNPKEDPKVVYVKFPL